MNAIIRSEADDFLARFRAFFAGPSPETYQPLFHAEGTLEDAGMDAPLPAAETGAAIAQVLSLIPDLRIEYVRHAVRGERVFVEARNRATLAGQALEWGAVYRVHLKDGLVHRGRRFYDQAELLAPVLPPGAVSSGFDPAVHRAAGDDTIPAEPGDPAPAALVARLAAAWKTGTGHALAALYAPGGRLIPPGRPAPVARADIASWRRAQTARFRHHEAEIVDWAAAQGGRTLFVEWRCHARHLGAPVCLDRIERHTVEPNGLIAETRQYGDTLGLLARENPALAEARARLVGRR
jgi:ketosteroid isomerase-like protein